MTKTEQLRRRVIELIHGLPYIESYVKDQLRATTHLEEVSEANRKTLALMLPPQPITLGRLLKAFNAHQVGQDLEMYLNMHGDIVTVSHSKNYTNYWMLTRPDGSEATLEDQSEETIEALHKLFCGDVIPTSGGCIGPMRFS